MLTIEMLNQNPVLSVLSDAQKASIVELSTNDENTVIGTKIGALHGQYDSDIFSITGIQKKDGEKSYDYAKRVLNEYKTKVASIATIKAELDSSKKQVNDLQAKLESQAGNEELTKQLNDAKARVSQLQSQLQTKQNEFDTEKAKYETSLRDIHVDYAFSAATSGLKFKGEIPESVKKILLDSAKKEVLMRGTPDFIDDGAGNKKLVFRDSNGIILNNAKNNLNPYTMNELVLETSLKDVLDTGKQQTGGGTSSNGGSSGGASSVIDLSGAKTQVEADVMIEKHLLSQGLTRDSRDFAEQSLQLRNENKVSELPIR